jgi:hypothetical protein
MELKYKGDIVQYVTTLLDLNETVRWSGTTFRSHVSSNLPSKIIEMVYQTRGSVPNTDDDFLTAIQEAGRVYENMLQDSGYSGRKTEHSKTGQQQRKDSRPLSDRNQSSRKPNGPTKDKKWNSVREALKDIDSSDIDQRKRDRVSCWRCGRDNHHTLECFARRDANNKELPQPVAERTAAIKRKSSDREEEGDETLNKDNEAQFKKAKVDAITASTRIMEIDSSDSDF